MAVNVLQHMQMLDQQVTPGKFGALAFIAEPLAKRCQAVGIKLAAAGLAAKAARGRQSMNGHGGLIFMMGALLLRALSFRVTPASDAGNDRGDVQERVAMRVSFSVNARRSSRRLSCCHTANALASA